MGDTRAGREASGRFAPSKGAKSKRVEVWLQPQTIELLDAFCSEWGIGRGKAIDRLLANTPTPKATPEPIPPAPTPSDPYVVEVKSWKVPVEPRTIYVQSEPATSGPHVTHSVRMQECSVGGQMDFVQFTDPFWPTLQADAKSLGIKGVTGDHVRSFKSQHKIPQATPLSPEAQQMLREHLNALRVGRSGIKRDQAERLSRLKKRATPQRLRLIKEALAGSSSTILTWGDLAAGEYFYLGAEACRDYFLSALEPIGIRPRKKPSPKLWQELLEAIPEAGGDHKDALFWGVVLRLADLEGEPPTDKAALLKWAHFGLRHRDSSVEALRDSISGRMTIEDARRHLGLPAVALTRKAITTAYKQLAREHHPDAGGNAEHFQRITEARDRLLMCSAVQE
jgi:hypothetical protein